MRRLTNILFILLLLFSIPCWSMAATTCTVTSPCNSVSALNTDIANNAVAGDTIYIDSNTILSTGGAIEMSNLTGDANNYFTLACSDGSAEDLGGCILGNDSTSTLICVTISQSSYVKIRGLYFKDIDVRSAVTGALAVDRSHHVVIEQNKFEEVGESASSVMLSLYSLYSDDTHDVEIRYNTFFPNYQTDRRGSGIELILRYKDYIGPMQGVWIHHNEFMGHDESDTAEAIQLGRGATSSSMNTNAIVEYNYFNEWDGDVEVISSKSSGHKIRYNYVKNCRASIKARQGSKNEIYSNIIIHTVDDTSRNWTALYAGGFDTKIYNNYIQDTYHGIRFQSGNPPSINNTLTSDPGSSYNDNATLTDSGLSMDVNQYKGQSLWMVDEDRFYGDDDKVWWVAGNSATEFYLVKWCMDYGTVDSFTDTNQMNLDAYNCSNDGATTLVNDEYIGGCVTISSGSAAGNQYYISDNDGDTFWLLDGPGGSNADPASDGVSATDDWMASQRCVTPYADGVRSGDYYLINSGYPSQTDHLVAHNTITNVIRVGIDLQPDSTNNLFQNNLVYNFDNGSDLYGMFNSETDGGRDSDSTKQTYVKNVVFNESGYNRPEWYTRSGTDPEPSGIYEASECGDGGDDCDPDMTSTTWMDYTPQATGGAHQFGTAHADVTVDIFGNPRHGSTPTPGAFEVGGNSNPGSISVGVSWDALDNNIPAQLGGADPAGGRVDVGGGNQSISVGGGQTITLN